jgi:putative RNA 2'-phosphotransferase
MPSNPSRLLSYVLRHRPQEYGLELGEGGWVSVRELLAALLQRGHAMTREQLVDIVRSNDKQRFALSADGGRIRANQGHSVAVDLQLTPIAPPAVLYHGTVRKALLAIREQGLKPKSRIHVHLSADTETARRVGTRRGQPVILEVRAAALAEAGHVFYRSDNGVWLTSHVPRQFIRFPPHD